MPGMRTCLATGLSTAFLMAAVLAPPEVVGEQEISLAEAQKGCDAGVASDCYALGARYLRGEQVSRDSARAAQLFEKACVGGDAKGCLNIAVLRENGEGIAKDLAGAAAAYQKACDAKIGLACYGLGSLYDLGGGVGKDSSRALKLWEGACDGGNGPSCRALGHKYLSGEGVAKDLPLAFRLLNKSCYESDGQGCYLLGVMYVTGQGVAESVAQASDAFKNACAQGEARGCEGLTRLGQAAAPPPAAPQPPAAPRTSLPRFKGRGVVLDGAYRGEPKDVLALAITLVPQEGAKDLLVAKEGVAKIRYAEIALLNAQGGAYPMWATRQPVEAAGGEPFESKVTANPGELLGTFYFLVPVDAKVDAMTLRMGIAKVPLKGIRQQSLAH